MAERKNEFGISFLKTKKGKAFALAGLLCLILIAVALWYTVGRKSPAIPVGGLPKEGETFAIGAPFSGAAPMRGVYIATVSNLNFPSRSGLSPEQGKEELERIVENCASIGFDTLVFQVRPSCDALYDSTLFPSSRFLVKNEGDALSFDPLAVLCALCAERDMKVVAWINPYRVTTRTFDTKEAALASLSEQNPARLHPEWTLFYAGKLYFDPASSDVRTLIAAGSREVCEKYDVAGVLFDDYFYPYPVKGVALHDLAEKEAAQAGMSVADYRRDSVNALMRAVHQAVKSVSDSLSFGAAPFGIWRNAGSDPRGSDTRGLDAYASLYCDALAWIEEESVDYLAPQIYWERGHSAADFRTLSEWWAKQVSGTGVGLCISYAAYKAGDFARGGEEIASSMQYVEDHIGRVGSIQYGYAALLQNTASVRDAVAAFYQKDEGKGEMS